MIEIFFKPGFIRQFNNLEKGLDEEVLEKVELFKDPKNHAMLKVHKLHGQFSGCSSFSVNYKTRIVFEYELKDRAVLLLVGDHDIYK